MAIRPRREVHATDAQVDIVGNSAAITFLTDIESDLTLVLSRSTLEVLRSRIAFALTRAARPTPPGQ